MLETYLTSSVTSRRLRTGPAADHIDAFADWLHLQGYRPVSIKNLLTALAGWMDWMIATGFTAPSFVPAFAACKLAPKDGAGVSAVLRHRSAMTTAHYAKVDFGLLSEIAQPWPEVSAC
jgi:CubicO group peptidase (beta-lactamase class C family)